MIAASAIRQARAIRIENELARRGIKMRGKIERAAPCPVCGGHDRFSINVRKQVFNCRGCQIGGDVIKLTQLLDGCTFAEAIETLGGERPADDLPTIGEQRSEPETPERRRRIARWLWSQRRPIVGSPAEHYLREARCYAGPLPATLAYLPPRGEHGHAMIAAHGMPNEPGPGILAIADDALRAVHITRLAPAGSGKDEAHGPAKVTIASPIGCPIVLAPVNDLGGLAITEGIEDALSVHVATGLGAWAAGSAPFVPHLADVVPAYVEVAHVIVDDDPSGRRHASELVQRLRARGFEVLPRMLRLPGAAA